MGRRRLAFAVAHHRNIALTQLFAPCRALRYYDSDILIGMREMTASEASRHFSAVLDSAEQGEAMVITRGGKRVATIAPVGNANGAALRTILDRWRGNDAVDDAFAQRVADVRRYPSAEMDADPWHD